MKPANTSWRTFPAGTWRRGMWWRGPYGEGHRVFLDARAAIGADFPRRFPVIAAACAAAGIDPATEPMPIRVAAHYHMGGVAVDRRGRSKVVGLWACGEVAGTGLHGANRLASNSLLEAVVGAGWVAEDIAGASAGRAAPVPAITVPAAPDAAAVRPVLSRAAGVLRESRGLTDAVTVLLRLVRSDGPMADPALVALIIAAAALQRQESRGAHHRSDFPHSDPACQKRRALTLATLMGSVQMHEDRHGLVTMTA